jgi:hypothetical protein
LQPALGALGAGTAEAERALVSLSSALECRVARASFVAGARAACDGGLQVGTLLPFFYNTIYICQKLFSHNPILCPFFVF